MNRNSVVASLLLAASSFPALASNILIVNVADDPAGAGTCPAACSLRQAITTATGGARLMFDPSLASPITLSQGALMLDKALTIQGPGAAKLTVSANNTSQVLIVSAQALISGLTLADGYITGTAGSNGAGGASGASGVPGGPGGTGGPGGLAGGACVQVANNGALVLDHVAVRHCIAYGGSGGNGGTGGAGDLNPADTQSPGGAGGNSGAGGDATGGAILVYGSLSLLNSSVVDGHAYGGAGGAGAAGGIGNSGGNFVFGASGLSGAGGAARGGAVFVAAGSLRITNSTIAGGSGTGGTGGAGVTTTQDVTSGGAGGAASGGLIRVDASAALADLEFSTLAGGQVVGGSGGSGFIVAPSGNAAGNAISAAITTTALSSVVVDVQSGSGVSLCNGFVIAAPGSVNLDEDGSCGFSLQGTFAQLFHPLDVTTTPWPGYLPFYHSAVIDAAATCQDLAAQTVANDQHDTLRPQGTECDLGAIEADYIFVDGFE